MPPTRRSRRGTSSSCSSSTSRGRRSTRNPVRRRSSRGNSAISELAKEICLYQKRVVFITGAGISVASGVRPFRGSGGVWTQHIWSTATREAFRKDPLGWYNDFWLPCLSLPNTARPNDSHYALSELLHRYPHLRMITQNVDGLSPPSSQLIEAHGRLGLYKCIPSDDSDTDSDSDDDDERLVHLGHRRKRRLASRKRSGKTNVCRYQQMESLPVEEIEPANVRQALMQEPVKRLPRGSSDDDDDDGPLSEAPRCPSCRKFLAPQALLFDEGYHSHDFYQFQKMEDWLAEAEIIVFVGTSFAVRLPEVTLEHARSESIPVYNFNTNDFLESTVRLNATNVTGPAEETIPKLLRACQELQAQLGIVFPRGIDATTTPASSTTAAATTASGTGNSPSNSNNAVAAESSGTTIPVESC